MPEKNLKNFRKELQSGGVFYTNEKLAKRMAGYLPPDLTEIYDPTCGSGGLLSVFPDEVKKYGQEIDAEQAQVARDKLHNCEIVAGDTLKEPAFMGHKFRGITANYPYSVRWEVPAPILADERFQPLPCMPPASKADYAFIAHILYYLADDGTAAVLGPHGVLFRGNAEGKIRQWLIEKNYIDKVIGFGPKEFVDTSIPTALLVLSKHKTTTDVWMEDTTVGVSRSVPLDEIRANEFNLNLPRYVAPPYVQPSYDFSAEADSFISTCVEAFKSDLNVLKATEEMEPKILDAKDFCRKVIEVIKHEYPEIV